MSFLDDMLFMSNIMDESVEEGQEDDLDLENDKEFMQECMQDCLPTFIQMELMENADTLDEDVKDAFMKVQDYMVGQGLLAESATMNLNNPKVTVVKLSKESQIKRLKTIIALKMARKNNDQKYKKYKVGAKIKKTNLQEIIARYGAKAERLARRLYEQNKKNRKMNAVVSEKKKKSGKK